MAGIFDKVGDAIRNAALDVVPGDAARKIPAAMSGATAGTTSGMDAAMQAHADKMHPVTSGPTVFKKRSDGTPIYPNDSDYSK